MRLAISTWVYGKTSLEDALNRLAGFGFKTVELWGDGFHLDPRVMDDDGAFRVRRLVEKLGLTVYSVHAPFSGLSLSSLDSAKREYSLKVVGRALLYAQRLDASFLVVHPSAGEVGTSAEGVESATALKDSLKRLGSEASRLRVGLALENMISRGPRLGSSVSELVELIAELGMESLGVCVDTGHSILNGLRPEAEVIEAGGLLKTVHINVNDGSGDQHEPPKPGSRILRTLINSLKTIGYSGPFLLEVYGGKEPDRVVLSCLKLVDYGLYLA